MTDAVPPGVPTHPDEPHRDGLPGRLSALRAGVLGANDGIVSVAGLVVGVAAATPERGPVLAAGLAGLVAGAVSMALGEYVSVASQRDAQRALLELERRELAEEPAEELAELAAIYRSKGLSPTTAQRVAEELTAHDALAAHAEVELRLDPDEVLSPWQAAVSSAVAFTVGALLPLLAIVLPPVSARVPTTAVATLLALALTGYLGARLGGAPPGRPVLRVVAGGALALALTYAVGQLVGTAIS